MRIDQELTKLYYSIGEVAEMFGVSTSLIRYWETEFSKLKPKKNSRGERQFQVKDIRKLEDIYTLVKERGFTLDGAKKELSKPKTTADSNNKAIKEKLNNVLRRLQKIRDRV